MDHYGWEMIQTSFFPQPEKEEPIRLIQKIDTSILQPRKVEELIPDKDILLDTYIIYPNGGYHPFYGVPNTFHRYQLPIWPYIKRIKFSKRFKNDKTLYNARKSSWDTNHLSSQINPFIRADYFSVGLRKSTRTIRNSYTTILKNGKHKTCLTRETHNEQMHRLVAKAWIPNPENHPFVLHDNDDSTNYLIENLKWGTQGDNMKERKLFRVPDGMKKRYLNLVNKGIIKG
jgi:hypothetical protein